MESEAPFRVCRLSALVTYSAYRTAAHGRCPDRHAVRAPAMGIGSPGVAHGTRRGHDGGMSTVSIMLTVALAVGTLPQTIFDESFTVKSEPDPFTVRSLP